VLRIRIQDRGLGAFLTPGSGIRDGRKSASGSGVRDEQLGSYFLELRNHFFAFLGLRYLISLMRINLLLDPDPDPHSNCGSESGSRRSTGCSLLRAEGFTCSLGVLYGGLGISKLRFLIKKIEIKFPAINFFSILGHQTLDPDPELENMPHPELENMPHPDPH
jgi:hypothetical protein